MQLLNEHGVKRPEDIDLDAMAASMGARLTYEDVEGAAARVVRIGDRAEIRISTRVPDIGYQRFSACHEFGHIKLDRVARRESATEAIERFCKPHDPDRRASERAANVFASELLMPEPMVKPRCEVTTVTLAPVRAIAREFRTSVLASALRFVELTTERCAVAYSFNGRVRWVRPSATFPDWIPRGRRLDPTSRAFEYHQTGEIDATPHVLPAEAWLPCDRIDGSNVEIVEHSAVIPELGVTFSLLWLPDREAQHLDLAVHDAF